MNGYSTGDIFLKEHTIIQHPCEFENVDQVLFGENVRVRSGTWFDASVEEAIIEIKDGCALGRNNQLSTSSRITFEKCVLTAANVHIATQTHLYEDINTPIMHQGSKDTGPITIGEGCWIGRNSVIIGASIGKGSVVASNSTVTKDVPDYCVVAGNPAKIIKRYNMETKQWERC